MEKVSFDYFFEVGEIGVTVDGNGEVELGFDLPTANGTQYLIFSIDQLHEIADKAYAHKIAYEDQKSQDYSVEDHIADELERIDYG